MKEPDGANLPQCCKHETCISGIHPDGLCVHTHRPDARLFEVCLTVTGYCDRIGFRVL